MIRRRPAQKAPALELAPPVDDFHEWVLGLPWVVERRYSLATPGVRAFAVDCEPLDLRQMWLVSGLRESFVGDIGVAVIVPLEAAAELEHAGCGRRLAPMPAGQVLLMADDRIDHTGLEELVLNAYCCAMAT
jgi:hypothetical protein